jgi:hypothetical protein
MSNLTELMAGLEAAKVRGGDVEARAQYEIVKYLRENVHSPKVDFLNDYQDLNDESCPLPIKGGKCVEVLNKCISASSAEERKACAEEWKTMDFGAGYDFNKMDLSTARNLIEKMGITSNKTVEQWKSETGVDLSATVLAALKAIVQRVRNPSGRSEAYGPVGAAAAPSLGRRVAFTRLAGGSMIGGGGGNRAVANFIQMSNYLKERYILVGGASNAVPSSVGALRTSLAELEVALEAKNKQIDAEDKRRIVQLFDSLQRTEEKADKAARYMSELKRIIAHPSFKNDSIGATVTAKIMQDLQTTHSTLLAASAKKGHSIVSVLDALTSAASELSALKALPGEIASLRAEISRLRDPGAAAAAAAAAAPAGRL